MGALICIDGETKPSTSCRGFSPLLEFDSSNEHSEDEDSDIRSFISGRSIPRQSSVHVQKKRSHPQLVTLQRCSWPSYDLQDSGKNELKNRETPGETPKSLDQTSLPSDEPRENSRKTKALLVVTDDDVKKQIKAIMEPYMQMRVQKIVDQAVEDMFVKVNTAEQHSCGSSQWVNKSSKAISTPSSGDSIHLNRVNKDVDHGKVATMKSQVITANTSLKSAYEPIVIKVSSQELSSSSEDPAIKSQTTKRVVSSIKLAQVPSLALESCEIKEMVSHETAKSALDVNNSMENPPSVHHDEFGQKFVKHGGST